MVKTDAGEDLIAVSEKSGYAANLEKATSKLAEIVDEASDLTAPEEFATPDLKTIEALANAFDFATPERQIKTLIYVASYENAEDKMILALLRGDHQLQETKLSDSLGAIEIRPAQDAEIFALLGAHPGSLGAVRAQETAKNNGKEIFVIADFALQNRANMTTGANKDDFHWKGVDVARDLQIDSFADLREVKAGELAPDGSGELEIYKSLEVGHIFKLGTKYSDSMNAKILDENGKAKPIVMGSYGIGVERILAAVIEQNHDENGIVWTQAVAPFDVVVTLTNIKEPEIVAAGEKLYNELKAHGFDVLLDDRNERAGVKFKDADLIGIPFRINIGKRTGEGIIELVNRRTRESEEINLSDALERLKSLR